MISKAYGAGYRAGRYPNRAIIHNQDGTKSLAAPECPYKKPLQFFHRLLWWDGYCHGTREHLEYWLHLRRGVYDTD